MTILNEMFHLYETHLRTANYPNTVVLSQTVQDTILWQMTVYKNVIMIVKLAVDMLLQLIAQTMCLKGQGQDLIQELVVQGHFLGQGHYKGQERRGSPRILHVLDTLAQVHRVQRRLAQTLRVAGQVQAVAPGLGQDHYHRVVQERHQFQ